MDTIRYPGEVLRDTLREAGFLQVMSVPNLQEGILAAKAGKQALHVGPGELTELFVTAHCLVKTTSLPVLVDAGIGLGRPAETLATVEALGAAGCYIDDHHEGKRFAAEAMQARFRQVLLARKHASFVITARCSGVAEEGIEATLARCRSYIAAGADMVTLDKVMNEGEYRILTRTLSAPLLVKMTEMPETFPFTIEQLREFGVQIVVT